MGFEHFAQPLSARGQAPAQSGWSCGKRAERRTAPGRRAVEALREPISAVQPAAPSAPAPATIAGVCARSSTPASASTAAGSAAGSAAIASGRDLVRLGRGANQPSIGTITTAGPRGGGGRVVGADDRPGTSCARAGRSAETGYTPARPSSFAGEERVEREVRRSCSPTTITSGAGSAGGGDRGHGVAQARRGVQERERQAARRRSRVRWPSRRRSPRAARGRSSSSGRPARTALGSSRVGEIVVSPRRRRTLNVASRRSSCRRENMTNRPNFGGGGGGRGSGGSLEIVQLEHSRLRRTRDP